MYAFSDWIISLFEKNGIVLKHNRSTYVYGLDIFLYTILSTAGLLLIGYVSHHFYESILLIILFLHKPNLWRWISCQFSYKVLPNHDSWVRCLPSLLSY